MNPKLRNDAMSDSLKRKRDTLAEDATPDVEDAGLHGKRERAQSEGVSLTDATLCTANTLESSVHTDCVDMNPVATATDSNSTEIDTNTAPADHIVEAEDRLSKPSLKTLPQELRDQIYSYLAATEGRIVLGRRMVDACREGRPQTLYKSFEEAIALHPLSMTCRQFRDEFQKLHV
jgi:hypothetical protein